MQNIKVENGGKWLRCHYYSDPDVKMRPSGYVLSAVREVCLLTILNERCGPGFEFIKTHPFGTILELWMYSYH